MEVGRCAGALTKAIIFSANQVGERSRVLLFCASNKSDIFFNQSVLKQKRFFFQLSESPNISRHS
jgi:hypothetical protein